MTPTEEWALEMAQYARWQNESVGDLCDALSDAERKRDRGMFFQSLHGTVDHILHVDRVLLEFSESGIPPAVFEPARRTYDDWTRLQDERRLFDEKLVHEIRSLPGGWLDEVISFRSERLGRPRSHPRRFLWMQMFNHGTHHRSQVTAELHKMGIDYGVTDLPFNPYSLY